jgi:sterol desaturase/sphingolipid hydroxylase (fatty acid hydroxylase superfamily)
MKDLAVVNSEANTDTKGRWKNLWYFQAYFFYPPIFLFLAINAAMEIGWQHLIWSLPLGAVIWGFIEYTMHRWIFHQEVGNQWWRLLPWAHKTHHKHPREISLIFAPVWFSLPISILVFGILALAIGNIQVAILVLIGIWTGYLWYEFVHYTAHCRQPKTRLMRYLKTYHLLHHHVDAPIWFGVTSPVVDHLFGTHQKLPKSAKNKQLEKG